MKLKIILLSSVFCFSVNATTLEEINNPEQGAVCRALSYQSNVSASADTINNMRQYEERLNQKLNSFSTQLNDYIRANPDNAEIATLSILRQTITVYRGHIQEYLANANTIDAIRTVKYQRNALIDSLTNYHPQFYNLFSQNTNFDFTLSNNRSGTKVLSNKTLNSNAEDIGPDGQKLLATVSVAMTTTMKKLTQGLSYFTNGINPSDKTSMDIGLLVLYGDLIEHFINAYYDTDKVSYVQKIVEVTNLLKCNRDYTVLRTGFIAMPQQLDENDVPLPRELQDFNALATNILATGIFSGIEMRPRAFPLVQGGTASASTAVAAPAPKSLHGIQPVKRADMLVVLGDMSLSIAETGAFVSPPPAALQSEQSMNAQDGDVYQTANTDMSIIEETSPNDVLLAVPPAEQSTTAQEDEDRYVIFDTMYSTGALNERK